MSDLIANKAKLLAILKKKSVFHGDFILSSGARSRYYFDCKLTTLHPEGAWLVGRIFWQLIREEASRRRVKIDAVGGLTMGADPIAFAIGSAALVENPEAGLEVFLVRKEPKSHGQNKLIEGNFARGNRVVVLDDVITKGDATLRAIKAIQEAGGIVEFAAVLVDRGEGGREKIVERGVPVISVFTKKDVLDDDVGTRAE